MVLMNLSYSTRERRIRLEETIDWIELERTEAILQFHVAPVQQLTYEYRLH